VEHADLVVAMDGDWMAVEKLYRAQKGGPDARKILPRRGNGDHTHAGGMRRANAGGGILEGQALGRRHAQPPGGQ
jgi:hypothetical protein